MNDGLVTALLELVTGDPTRLILAGLLVVVWGMYQQQRKETRRLQEIMEKRTAHLEDLARQRAAAVEELLKEALKK